MSITLTNQEQFTIGGTPVETNNIAGVTGFTADYLNNTLTLSIATGSPNSGNIAVSQRGAHLTAVINLATGVCQVNGQPAGTMPAGALANLNVFLRNTRNNLETLAVLLDLVAGVQLPW